MIVETNFIFSYNLIHPWPCVKKRFILTKANVTKYDAVSVGGALQKETGEQSVCVHHAAPLLTVMQFVEATEEHMHRIAILDMLDVRQRKTLK